jgi:hypothetical protein
MELKLNCPIRFQIILVFQYVSKVILKQSLTYWLTRLVGIAGWINITEFSEKKQIMFCSVDIFFLLDNFR